MQGFNNYTAKDIERYHSGQLSAAERHALEKAALDDHFLADALEGYVFTMTPATDLASLQHRIENRVSNNDGRRKAIFMGHSWMRVAALFVLFAGGGWIIFKTLSTNKEEIAVTQQQLKLPDPTPAPRQAIDSPETSPEVPATQETVALNKDRVSSKDPARHPIARQSADEKPPMAPTATYLQPNTDSDEKELYANRELLTSRNKLEDSVAKENDLAKNKNAAITTPPDTIKNVDVVLQRSDVALNEVVVINPKVAKKSTSRKMKVIVDTLEPANGWGYFDDYIAGNIKSPEELKNKPLSGEVELSFDVNKQGEPVNITVTKSLCGKCDEEAIRLLKEGPKWKNGKKGKVKIRF